MKYIKNIVLLTTLFISSCLYAQDFYGGITAGPSLIQYHGDGKSGFNKIGFKIGAFVTRETKSNWSYQLQLCFNQKGSKISSDSNQVYYNLRLRYIEVPISIRYSLKGIHIPGLIDIDFKNKVLPHAGLSFGYLMQAKEDNQGNGLVDALRPFHPFEIGGQLGLTIFIIKQFAFDLRLCHSITPVRDNPGGQTYRLNRGHYNRVIEMNFNYRF